MRPLELRLHLAAIDHRVAVVDGPPVRRVVARHEAVVAHPVQHQFRYHLDAVWAVVEGRRLTAVRCKNRILVLRITGVRPVGYRVHADWIQLGPVHTRNRRPLIGLLPEVQVLVNVAAQPHQVAADHVVETVRTVNERRQQVANLNVFPVSRFGTAPLGRLDLIDDFLELLLGVARLLAGVHRSRVVVRDRPPVPRDHDLRRAANRDPVAVEVCERHLGDWDVELPLRLALLPCHLTQDHGCADLRAHAQDIEELVRGSRVEGEERVPTLAQRAMDLHRPHRPQHRPGCNLASPSRVLAVSGIRKQRVVVAQPQRVTGNQLRIQPHQRLVRRPVLLPGHGRRSLLHDLLADHAVGQLHPLIHQLFEG